jgi:hypothetical protein
MARPPALVGKVVDAFEPQSYMTIDQLEHTPVEVLQPLPPTSPETVEPVTVMYELW